MAATVALAAVSGLLLGGCERGGDAALLMRKAKLQWEEGQFEDAARNFVTVAELQQQTPMAEESLFWAANLYQHFLKDSEQAARHYQQLIVDYPKGRYFYEAKENLAEVYELDKNTRHRALQLYQQLVLAEPMKDRLDALRYKIGSLNLSMGKMDQARQEFRDLLVNHPASRFRGDAYYLIGYSYYLEKRYDLALLVFRQTVRDFPGTPLAVRAQFFLADTLEERGRLRDALKTFKTLKDKYPNPRIVAKRIETLTARIKRGVR